MSGITITQSVAIKAPTSKVWQALTDPALVKQYFFGVDVISDWKIGSPLVYRGSWNGKQFEDKGTIIECEPEKSLVTTYWSEFSGLPDTPENYQTVSYKLSEEHGITTLMVMQTNNPSEAAANSSKNNWNTVLESLKKLVENM